jgi:hypothetical protein
VGAGKLSASCVGTAMLAAGLLNAEIYSAGPAYADAGPHEGDPCNQPARAVNTSNDTHMQDGYWIVCANNHWTRLPTSLLSTSQIATVGNRCLLPQGFNAIGLTEEPDPDKGGGAYLVTCIHGIWTIYPP